MNKLLELAAKAEESANLGNAIDIKLMMNNYALMIIEEALEIVYDEITYELSEEKADEIILRVGTYFGVE
jgi:hypothetical protein